ncbi:MAG: DUF4179 domain-containing protein [Oscillospiraceae bacterium]|nr:DUF4179 domain-containing protein [Oscillospiraceae bacterium]
MRTSEERVRELHRRMAAMEREKSRRRYQLLCAAACTACLAITVAMALVIASLPIQSTDMIAGSAAASIFADHASLGYVVVALLAFCLGVLVTIFCLRMKNHIKENRDDDRLD